MRLTFTLTLVLAYLVFSPVAEPQQQAKQKPAPQHQQNASRPASAKVGKALSPQEAFDILTALNDRDALVPRRLMDMGLTYNRLSADNCFGVTFPNAKRLVGESRGEGYGMTLDNSALIGLIYSEGALLLEGRSLTKWAGKPLGRGGYAVFASVDQLKFFGESDTDYFEMTAKLDPTLLDEQSNRRPRFSVAQDGKGISLVVGGNRFAIKSK